MATVVINVYDSEAGTTAEYSFNKSPVRIGRNPLNDLALPFPFVSGWHGVVRFDEHGAKFFDLGSTNGTLHNGRRVEAGEAVPVAGVTALQIGQVELRVHQPQAEASASPVPPPADPPAGDRPLPPGVFGPTAELPAQPSAVPHPPVDALVPRHNPLPGSGTGAHPAAGHPGAPSAGSETTNVGMGDVHQLVNRLRPSYENFRSGWRTLHTELHNGLSGIEPRMRAFSVSILQREFPELAKEPEFARLAEGVGGVVDRPETAASPVTHEADAEVARLSSSLCPDEPPPQTTAEVQRFLSALEDVLRLSARALVEQQKGQEELGRQVGVRMVREFTALHAAGTAENVLRYLLDWRNGGPHRTQELKGAYADLMIHQVAFLRGVMAGVRALMSRLAPSEIERRVTAGWPTRASAIWKEYTERFTQISAEEKSLMRILFGPEFARAYAEVGGESGSGGGDPHQR